MSVICQDILLHTIYLLLCLYYIINTAHRLYHTHHVIYCISICNPLVISSCDCVCGICCRPSLITFGSQNSLPRRSRPFSVTFPRVPFSAYQVILALLFSYFIFPSNQGIYISPYVSLSLDFDSSVIFSSLETSVFLLAPFSQMENLPKSYLEKVVYT